MDKARTRADIFFEFYQAVKSHRFLPELSFVNAVSNDWRDCRIQLSNFLVNNQDGDSITVDWREPICVELYDAVGELLNAPNPNFLHTAPAIRLALEFCMRQIGDADNEIQDAVLKIQKGDKLVVIFKEETPCHYALGVKTALQESLQDVDIVLCNCDIRFAVIRQEPADAN